MYRIHAIVEGMGRGLLMHKFSVGATAQLESRIKRASSDHGTPEAQAEAGAYRLDPEEGQDKGQLMLPAEHFLGALTSAGSQLQVQGKGKATYRKVFKGGVDVLPAYIGLTDKDGRPLFDYAVDSRPVKIKATQGRVIRHRPHIQNWRADFLIEVGDNGIPLEVVQAALEQAGKSECVGDFRPRFGSFRIVSFDAE